MSYVWHIMSLSYQNPNRDIGIRIWNIDSAIYLIYSNQIKYDDEEKLLFDKGWQLYYNGKYELNNGRKINRQTVKTILYGLTITKIKQNKLLGE